MGPAELSNLGPVLIIIHTFCRNAGQYDHARHWGPIFYLFYGVAVSC